MLKPPACKQSSLCFPLGLLRPSGKRFFLSRLQTRGAQRAQTRGWKGGAGLSAAPEA